jgi:pyruvate,water dikinase
MTTIHATDDFRFEWPDPADAAIVWMWDQMHMPRPMPLLAGIIGGRVMGKVMGGRSMTINGYPYRTLGGPPPWAAAMMGGAPPDTSAVDPIAIWEGEQLPQLKEIIDRIRGRDYEAMTSARITGMLDELVSEAGEALALTFGRAMLFSVATNVLLDFCEAEIGPGTAVRATSMLQGFDNESAASGAGLSRLTEMASGLPAVAQAIRESRFDGIASETGGAGFMKEFQAYLDTYGSRAPSWGQVHLQTWAEDPTVPLRLIASYLADPQRSPAASLMRARAEREAAIRDMEAALAPGKLPRFREVLKAAQASVPVSEGRAMWQLIGSAVLRVPLLALGRKLVAEGYIESPDDVFHFSDEELADMANSRPLPNPRELAAKRRAELAHWETLTPPRFLGAPPPTAMLPMMARFMGMSVEQSADPRTVTGIAASKGVVRAVARVVMDLRDSHRLGAGEVLVCPSTAPPWTPLFAIAGAVVTDSGGVLSHSAIAAREYAIPAVVGTGAGTQRIPDGAIVSVDGGRGIVRIEV